MQNNIWHILYSIGNETDLCRNEHCTGTSGKNVKCSQISVKIQVVSTDFVILVYTLHFKNVSRWSVFGVKASPSAVFPPKYKG